MDGTLADYTNGWQADDIIGDPVPEMYHRVCNWIREGREVRIFTARVWPITEVITADTDLSCYTGHESGPEQDKALDAAEAIRQWSLKHFGHVIPITCVKDKRMVELYDDRCVQVIANTGKLVGSSSRGIPA